MLTWETVASDAFRVRRARVEGGWFVLFETDVGPDGHNGLVSAIDPFGRPEPKFRLAVPSVGAVFYPDPEHRWQP